MSIAKGIYFIVMYTGCYKAATILIIIIAAAAAIAAILK